MPEPKASLVGRDCPLGKTLEHPRDMGWKGLERRIKTLSTQTHTHTYSQRHTQIIWGLVWHFCQGAVKGKDETLWHTETSHTYMSTNTCTHTFRPIPIHTHTHKHKKRYEFPSFSSLRFPHPVSRCYSFTKLACSSSQRADKILTVRHKTSLIFCLLSFWKMGGEVGFVLWKSLWSDRGAVLFSQASSPSLLSTISFLPLSTALSYTNSTMWCITLSLKVYHLLYHLMVVFHI